MQEPAEREKKKNKKSTARHTQLGPTYIRERKTSKGKYN